jgi:hypothetical protein
MPDRFADIRHGPQAKPVATAAAPPVARAAVVAGAWLLAHFQEKWNPVFRPKMRQCKKARAVSVSRQCATVLGAILAGAMLVACSTGSDTSFSIFVDPAKYDYYTCQQLAADLKGLVKRRQELKSLMDRADQSTGGAAVGFLAYKADYVATGEDLDLLQSTVRSKKCDQDETWRSSAAIR